MTSETFKVSGMSCAACSARIEKELGRLNGVVSVEAVFAGNTVTVSFDPDKVSEERIASVLDRIGYPVRGNGAQTPDWDPRKIILSGILSVILFVYAMGPMFGLDIPGSDDPRVYSTVQLALCLPVLLMCKKFFVKGARSLMSGTPTMDTLVSLGSGAAFVYSVYITVRSYVTGMDAMGICFDSAAMILTLISVGKYLEWRSRMKADDAVNELLALVPDTANVIRDGEELTVPTSELTVGDTVIVRPGERISADGEVVEGRSSVDESMLTGEHVPVLKSDADQVYSGTMNVDGTFTFRVTGIGENTMISDIAAMMEEAKSTKAPIARMADRVAARFVPAVIAISLISAALWLIAGKDIPFALNIAISVLVVSCPCALGLATPLAITVGSGRAAELGILFRDASSLERSGRTDSVILDKTGTVTYGRPVVESFDGPDWTLPAIGAGESLSEHPVGRAISEYCSLHGDAPDEDAKDFEYTVGRGISFTYGGHRYNVGSGDEAADGTEGTVTYVSVDGEPYGRFVLSDRIRDESPDTVGWLSAMGVDVHMVTGDNEGSASSVADACGIRSYMSKALPADKVMYVKKEQARGRYVMMVGDGINDSPALAQADVGVSMRSGSDIALTASDVVLMNDDLANVPRTIECGKAVLRNIKQNLFLAVCYNGVCIPFMAGLPYLFGMSEMGHMPMLAAAAMSLSSLSVVSNALRLRRFRPSH
ncbi:MAG: heavy metal translocating P-type ATPase [Candidatus Methanomethylophilaceae archaeon]